jgi:hypothetical protein
MTIDKLNEYGQLGWELASVDFGPYCITHIFKREIETTDE